MSALTVSDVHCADNYCPLSIQCTECTAWLCPAHDTEYAVCVTSDEVLHHVDCADECVDCTNDVPEEVAAS